jgi:GDP-D-mannose dehydratase
MLDQARVVVSNTTPLIALTGVTGQDGSYPAEFLLEMATQSTASSAAPARSRLIHWWTLPMRMAALYSSSL